MILATDINDMQQNIKNWKQIKGEKDQDLINCYTQDRKDLRKLLTVIKKEDYKKAYKIAYWMDTVVRDQIPKKIWNVLENHDLN